MAHNSIANNLQPAEFVRQAMTMGRTGFGLLYPDTQLLLVHLTEESGELVEGLMACTSNAEATDARRATIDFHTDKSTDISGLFRLDKAIPKLDETTTRSWKALLSESHHFVVPIRKRIGADAMSVDRISIGRARNKDLVLRHGSVSKFHGWFQLAEEHGLCFMDVGSKNGSRVNGKPVERRALVPVHAGDRVQIGRIECLVCTPDVLWTALHRAPMRSVRPR
ncbi:MAG: FHA domain-containing protein [Polyangiaceae bacterium]